MSAWRRMARECLPTAWHRVVERAETPMALWCEVDTSFAFAHRADPPDLALIEGCYRFAWWSVSASRNDAVESAAVVAFYEDLVCDRHVRAAMHRHLSRQQFLGMQYVICSSLDAREREAFKVEFLKRRDRLEREAG